MVTQKQPTPPIGGMPVSRPELVRAQRPADWKAPHPLYCVWEITLKCDLGCKHCGSRAGHERDAELDTAGCLDVVGQLADIGFREVTLIGGEAYLRDDWDVIAREIAQRGMTCGITTGARNLTEDRVRRAVDAGIRTISVSIDGLERTHDAQRGARGSFSSAVDACRRIAKTPIRLANNTQINRLSMPELPALASLLADMGSKAWQIQLTVPMGRGADRTRLLLEPYELLGLYPLLVWIKDERLEPGGVTLFPGNNIGYFGPYEGALRYNGDLGAHWGGCPAGEWSIGLEADGKIKACPSLPSGGYTGGNTKTMRIADALANARPITFIKQRTRADLWGFCRSCYYADVCKAGCTWTSQVFMGRPGNNPYCVHRAVEQEKAGLRERLVKVADAPGVPFDQGRYSLAVEPIPADGDDGKVSGFTLEEIGALDWRSGGIWSDERIAKILAPDSRRRLSVID
jgi:radical SAM protein with 4Fe4S-binding SPASM domain